MPPEGNGRRGVVRVDAMSENNERMLSPDYLTGLQGRPIDEVRAMRADCIEVETGLSYLRRMVQGPLDIVSHELARRAKGEGAADLATVIAELPETLGDVPRPPGTGRLTQTLEPTLVDPDLDRELDQLVGNARLSEVGRMAEAELSALANQLRTYESKVSDRRKVYFEVIDALQAEIARRYRDGEASVEALLDGA
jgi:anti-sigma-K factor RsiG